MFKKFFIIFSLIAFLPLQALAQSNCASTENVLRNLHKKFKEVEMVKAIDGQGYLFQFFANDETGTWTVLKTSPRGITCAVDSGTIFEIIKNPKPLFKEGEEG